MRRSCARRCRRIGRMKPIVMPSLRTALSHHPTARPLVGWRENAGVRTSSGQGILYGALAKTASVIHFINQRATTVVLAHRIYPNNPASLIQHPRARTDGNSWLRP